MSKKGWDKKKEEEGKLLETEEEARAAVSEFLNYAIDGTKELFYKMFRQDTKVIVLIHEPGDAENIAFGSNHSTDLEMLIVLEQAIKEINARLSEKGNARSH